MKTYKVTVNGQSFTVSVEELSGHQDAARPGGFPGKARGSSPTALPLGQGADVKAPMPGTLLAYKVEVGQMVKTGQVVCVLEAMKMENEIASPTDGRVEQRGPEPGATVREGDLLIKIG